jgi:hypothetical protein
LAHDEPLPDSITVAVRSDRLRRALKQDRFVHALRLARAANSIRFLIDAATSHDNSDAVEAIRARSTGGVLLAAALQEALHVLRYPVFHNAVAGAAGYEELAALAGHPVVVQLRDGYLARVRSKLAFHHVVDDIRAAMRRKQPDIVVAVQWDLTPSSGPFYVVPEHDVLLSIRDRELPAEADVAALQAQYPHTQFIAVPKGELTRDVYRYFRMLSAVLVVAFTLCHLIDNLLLPMFEALASDQAES